MFPGLLRHPRKSVDRIIRSNHLGISRDKAGNNNRSRSVLHVQKALSEMNVQLDSVISDIMGVTGQRILRAIVDGERDPQMLAAMRDRRTKRVRRPLRRAWRGRGVKSICLR